VLRQPTVAAGRPAGLTVGGGRTAIMSVTVGRPFAVVGGPIGRLARRVGS